MLHTHRLSMVSFDAVAACEGNAAIVERLKQTSRSRRLALLRAVLDRAAGKPLAPLPGLDKAWDLLVAAQRRDSAAVEYVVANPQIGLWAAKALRCLRNPGRKPLWAELGYLHLTAVAAGIRAGLDFRLRVPVWNGVVVIPTLGLARLPGSRSWDIAEVHGGRGTLLIRGTAGSVRPPVNLGHDGPGWQAMRQLTEGPFAVWLDDLDPYRGFREPIAPQRIPAAEAEQWQREFTEAWRLLSESTPSLAEEIATGLGTLVPLPPADRINAYSASHADAFGCVALSLPPDPAHFAATLVHEFQHTKLSALTDLVDLIDANRDDGRARYYAPWRNDPRPAEGLLHGLYSFFGVVAFHRTYRTHAVGSDARLAHFEFAYGRERTTRVARTLTSSEALTPMGHRFTDIIEKRLATWNSEPVPPDILAAARRTALDHYVTWRLHHFVPDAHRVARLAEAWLTNHRRTEVPRPETELREGFEPFTGPAGRAELTRVLLGDPELFETYRAMPDLAATTIPGVTAADLALVDGDTVSAARAYRERLAADPTDRAAWTGLGLALPRTDLVDRPELVYAVHRGIAEKSGENPDPAALAAWLAT